MAPERVERAIRRKYDALSESTIGPDTEASISQWSDSGLWYKFYSGGMIITDSGRAAIFVPTKIFALWAANELCSGMGYVKADPVEIDGGKSQVFSNGVAFLADGAQNAFFVWNGPISDKYAELGSSSGELGFPTSPRRNDFNRELLRSVAVASQTFENGEIACLEYLESQGVECFAVDANGLALPRRSHQLSVSSIRCIEETNGVGSDEAGFSFVTSPAGEPSTVQRLFYGDMDSGEIELPGLVLYDGPLLGALALSVIGLEKDGPRKFESARDTYEQTMILLDQELTAPDPSLGLAAMFGVGATIGASGVAMSITTGLLIVIIPAVKWAGTELLAVDRIFYLGDLLARNSGTATSVTIADNMPIEGTPLTLSVSVEPRSVEIIRERRVYRNNDEDSTYEITLMHRIS